MVSPSIKFIFCSILVGLVACSKDYSPRLSNEIVVIPDGFPAMDFPADNAFSPTRWQLGKALFYDTRLSKDSSVSCGSCHNPQLAFSENKKLSRGFDNRIGTRNAPTLANVGYHPYFTRDGGVPSLEMQVLVPIQEHNEFNFNIIDIGERLKDDAYYDSLSQLAYSRGLDYYVLVRAIATFERSLISGNSAVDEYRIGGDYSRLTNTEIAGMNLFYSDRTNCSVCHAGVQYSDFSFQNNGLYQTYKDLGRYRLTGDSADIALFKVPTLRNVGVTAPYMHDGSFTTLEEVVNHYSEGGVSHRNKSHLIKPLGLTNRERHQLIAFLNALTDYQFLTNKKLK